MGAWIDLHCHWVSGIDDGARTPEEGVTMLRNLADIGFRQVIATPHMRPGLFENTKQDIERAFAAMAQPIQQVAQVEVGLSSEHYFDDVVYQRILSGQALPYPGGRAVLLEFYEMDLPTSIDHQLAKLRRNQLIPVIAHPERYRAIWSNPETLERLLDSGAVALLDTAALVGKYGRVPRRCAEQLLDAGLYHAACSDAHRPADAELVAAGVEVIRRRYGAEEVERLLVEGPHEILAGTAST